MNADGSANFDKESLQWTHFPGESLLLPVPIIALPENWSLNTRPRLEVHLEHLKALADSVEWPDPPIDGFEWPALADEVNQLAELVQDWADAARERADERGGDELEDRASNLEDMANGLDSQDLDAAIDALNSF